jgi:hypothetical protein
MVTQVLIILLKIPKTMLQQSASPQEHKIMPVLPLIMFSQRVPGKSYYYTITDKLTNSP